MANMKSIFVQKPIKTEVTSSVKVDGVFSCQLHDCDGEAEQATKIEDRLYWNCPDCGHKSSMASFI